MSNKRDLVAHSIERMIQYMGTDTKRINHALKVYALASCIAKQEQLSNDQITVVEIAGVLHDIGYKEAKRKHNSPSGKYQEMEGPGVTRMLLAGCDIPPIQLDRICFIIGNHHSYNKFDGEDFQILVEADFIVNIAEGHLFGLTVENIKKKIFKTNTGLRMIDTMYLQNEKI